MKFTAGGGVTAALMLLASVSVSSAGITMNAAKPGTVDYFIDDGAQCFGFKKGETTKVVCAQKGSYLDFYDAHVFQKWFWFMVPLVEPEVLRLEVDFVPERDETLVRLSDGRVSYYAVGAGRDFQEAMENLMKGFLKPPL